MCSRCSDFRRVAARRMGGDLCRPLSPVQSAQERNRDVNDPEGACGPDPAPGSWVVHVAVPGAQFSCDLQGRLRAKSVDVASYERARSHDPFECSKSGKFRPNSAVTTVASLVIAFCVQ